MVFDGILFFPVFVLFVLLKISINSVPVVSKLNCTLHSYFTHLYSLLSITV